MRETNITRRRVLQGAGAVGVASLGSTVISAQEGDGGGGGQSAAIRVAHASPDAPNVDVRLNSMDDGGAGGDGNATGGGNATGDGNATGGNETGDGQGGGQDGGGDGPSVGGLGFRDVSDYNEVEPGTYQVQIVPGGEGPIEGFIQDLFGGGDEGDETVLFEDQVDVEAGTNYTVVAFGEVARGPLPAEDAEMDDGAGNETDGGMAGNETDGGMAGNETGGAGNETDGMAGNESEAVGQNETDGGMAGNETDGTDGGTTAQGEQLVSELSFGDYETVDLDAGDFALEFRESGAAGMDAGTGDAGAGNETGDAGLNETDGGMAGNETDGGMAGNETDGTTGGDLSGQSGDSDRGFQVQVLEDEVTDPGEGSSQLRIFHAVPDVDSMSVSQLQQDGGAQGGAGGGDGAGNETGDGPAGNETDGVGGDEGAGQQENDTAGGGAGPQDNETTDPTGQPEEEGVRRAQIATEANTVYSGFALGYFDPQAAATADGGGDGNETDGGMAGNETDGGMAGNETGGAGNETDGMAGNETGGNATGDGESGTEVAEDAEGEEFEFVTVEDAQGGDRANGGTGGLLDLALALD